MTEDTNTTENDLEGFEEEFDEEEELEDASDGAEGTSAEDQESRKVRAAREEARTAMAALEAAEKEDEYQRQATAFEAMPEAQRDAAVQTMFRTEKARTEFVERFEGDQRTKMIEQLVAGETDAFVEAYKRADSALQAELEDALSDDPDRLREVITEAAEHVVSLPEQEVKEGEEPPPPVDWQARWLEGPVAELTEDLDVFNAEAIADINKGRIRVAPQVREQLEGFLHEADRYPDGHSFRVKALQAAAGLASWARAEHEANVPWGLGGIQSTKHYMAPDGTWRQLQIDGRGTKRETAIEDPTFAGELGLIQDETAAPEQIDYENLSEEQAARLTPPQWMELADKRPDLHEKLLRRSSEEMERRHRESGSGGLM